MNDALDNVAEDLSPEQTVVGTRGAEGEIHEDQTEEVPVPDRGGDLVLVPILFIMVASDVEQAAVVASEDAVWINDSIDYIEAAGNGDSLSGRK